MTNGQIDDLAKSFDMGKWFDWRGFARALLAASALDRLIAEQERLGLDEPVALTSNQFAAIRAGKAALEKSGGLKPFGPVLQAMLDASTHPTKQSFDDFFDEHIDVQDTVSREWLRNFVQKWGSR